jgi:hypothetical protein
MMGTKPRLFTPITANSFDELVPTDHFYRYLPSSSVRAVSASRVE